MAYLIISLQNIFLNGLDFHFHKSDIESSIYSIFNDFYLNVICFLYCLISLILKIKSTSLLFGKYILFSVLISLLSISCIKFASFYLLWSITHSYHEFIEESFFYLFFDLILFSTFFYLLISLKITILKHPVCSLLTLYFLTFMLSTLYYLLDNSVIQSE